LLGFLMPEGMQQLGLNTSVYAAVLGAARAAAEAAGYALAVGTYTNGPDVVTVGDRLLTQGSLEGAILYRTRLADEGFERFRDLGLPFIVINRLFDKDPVNCVGTDHRRCGYLATQHLLSLGHRRIAFVTGGRTVASFLGRLEGYHQALAEAGAPAVKEFVLECDLAPASARQAIRSLLDLSEPPTAVVTANDRTALVAMETVQQAGLTVPGDLSLVGFDDAEEAAYMSPALTTVRVEWAHMADLAARMLVEALQRRVVGRIYIALEPQLMIRQTTAPPRGESTSAVPPAREARG
jgi:LacI family transcriptional regulator